MPKKKKTPQTDQWHNPQPLPTKNNHPTTTSKPRTTTHNHYQKSKLAKNHHTNHHQHSHTTTDPRRWRSTMKMKMKIDDEATWCSSNCFSIALTRITMWPRSWGSLFVLSSTRRISESLRGSLATKSKSLLKCSDTLFWMIELQWVWWHWGSSRDGDGETKRWEFRGESLRELRVREFVECGEF